MLTPQQQAKTYDKGYFYPGPAVKDVTLVMAPQESQDVINEVRPPRVRPADREQPVKVPPLTRPALVDGVRQVGQRSRRRKDEQKK